MSLPPEIEERLKRKIAGKLAGIALQIEGEAKRLCPRDTGNLANSIGVEKVDPDGLALLVGSFGVEYAQYPEFGTQNAPAQPYLRPAVEKVKAGLK